MSTIYLDIETLPSFNPQVRENLGKKIKPPATYKKPESIQQWMDENFAKETDEAHRKTSFDGALGHVCAIGYAIDDATPNVFYAKPEKEEEILRDFFHCITIFCQSIRTKPTFVGHNLVNFDLNFLRKRAIVLDVKPSSYIPFKAKPWDDSIFDTMTQWDAKNNISLDNLCKALGIEGKDGIDGSMVYDMVLQGRLEEVAEYCKHDVEITRSVYRRMNFLE